MTVCTFFFSPDVSNAWGYLKEILSRNGARGVSFSRR